MPESTTEAELAELAIAVYLEELATDQRVLYVGDPQSPGPERLAKVARTVELVSPRARARGTRRGGRVRSRRWPGDDEQGRWDLVVIPDLAASGLDEEDRLEQVADWLDDDGVLVAGAEASERGLSYEALFDLLQDLFDSVRMVGQARFRGFSLVDFDPPGDLEVTFDGSLLDGGGERAARYLALCSDEDVVLDSYAVVQVPAASVAAARAPEPAPSADADGRVSELNERIREQQDALDAANVHAEELERELEVAREELEQAAGDTDARAELKRQRDRARDDLAEARDARDELRARVDELEAALSAADEEESYDDEYARLETLLRESGRELTQVRNELERRAVLVRDLVEELAEARRHGSAPSPAPEVTETVTWSPDELQRSLQQQVADAVQRAVAAEADKAELSFRLDELRGRLAVAEQSRDQDIEEMRRMEAALRGTVRGLNARLAEVTELYQLAQARVQLLEEDHKVARESAEGFERELAEAREQLELEIARQSTTRSVHEAADTLRPVGDAPTIVASPDSDEAAALREGQLMGALMRCQDEATQLAVERQEALSAAEEAAAARLELAERVDGMRRGYELRLAEMGAELDAAGAEAERALVRSGELQARLESMERTEARLRGELRGTQLRLADREQAVKALVADADAERAPDVEIEAMREEMMTVRREGEALRQRLEEAARAEEEVAELRAKLAERATLEAEADALRSQVETSGRAVAEAAALRAELEEVRASIPPEAPEGPDSASEPQAPEPPAAVGAPAVDVGARDSMIARLQRELTDAVGRHRELEARLNDARSTLEAQKDRVENVKIEGEVGQEETIRELAELTDRLEQSEADRKAALDALSSVRRILAELTDGLPEGAGDGAPLTSGSGEIRALRERLSKLDELANDRELLLRSLTAQLQERDDRIRALESFDPQDQDDPEALKVRLLELEERAARLAEELENERQARRLEDR